MSRETRAKLVLVEPGAPAGAASLPGSGDSGDESHVLLLGENESLSGFDDRVRRRVQAMRAGDA